MNKKTDNLIESENGKLMSPEELFIYNEEQNLQSEIDVLEEGKLFALNTLRQEENIASEKLNYVLDKLSAAGIEVVTDKVEFNSILESQKVIQKISTDLSEIEKLSKQLNEEKLKTEKLEKTVVHQKSDIQHQNYEEFINYLDSVKDYIPEEVNFSEKMNIMGVSYYHKLTNKIPISFNSNGADEWLVKPDNNNEEKVYIVSSHYTDLKNINNYEDIKQYFTDNTVLTTFQESLTSFLSKNISLEKEKQKNFISDLDKYTKELKILEKKEARKNVKEWATKENYDLAFLNSSSKITEIFGSEIKAIGVLPQEINQIFPSITDYNLYAQKDYFIDHWVNHHSELTESIFDELQNVLDNYDDIYRDPDNETVAFVKQEGRLNDFLVVEQEDNKLVFYDSTFLRKGIPSRFEKITPVREQEHKNTVEVRHISSTARQGLSDPAAGISTLNGNLNISQTTTKSSPQQMVQNGNTYGFAYEGKIYLNPDIMNSEIAIHEYTHLWDNYTQKTNPELWEKGKNILKNTSYWYEVKLDPNYSDIANNDDLVLSEIHSRICGELADAVLTKIVEKDGVITKNSVIDWDEEVFHYILTEFQIGRERDDFDFRIDEEIDFTENLMEFLAQPMKDLMQGKIITNNIDNNVIIDEGIENIQSNHGSSETALEKDYKASLSDTYDEDVYDDDNYEYPFIIHNELEIPHPFSNRSVGTFYVLETNPIDLKSIYPDMDKLNENQKALIEYTKYEDGKEIFSFNIYENKNGKYIPQDLNKGLISRYSFSDGLIENIREYINELEFERKSPLDQYIILEARRVKFYNEENEYGSEYPKKEEKRIYNTLRRIDGKELIEKMELQTPKFKEYPKKLLGENYFGDKRCWSYLNDSMYDMLQNIEQKEHIKVMEKQKEYLISSNKTFIDNINNCLPANNAERIENILQNGDIINFEKNCENICKQIKQNNNSNNNSEKRGRK